jgi:N-acetylneuraminate synthase
MGLLKNFNQPIIIAEISGNHGGSFEKAKALILESAKAGADYVKLQTYKPETITVGGKDSRFKIKSGLWEGYRLPELYAKAMTPWEWHRPLFEYAQEVGIALFSSPFDESAVRFLEQEINPPMHKVASFELNHFPMLKEIGITGKPVIASVGVSTENEVFQAIDCLMSSGCPEITLLHCVSEYPAKQEDFFLSEMPRIKEKFQTRFGLSDHSQGHLVAVTATALGASVIEKHITLDREEHSIDGRFSMLPDEFAEMVNAVRSTVNILGCHGKSKEVSKESAFFKRSILVSKDIKAGDSLSQENIRIARPGDGLCPSHWEKVLGKRVLRNLCVGHPLSLEDINTLN